VKNVVTHRKTGNIGKRASSRAMRGKEKERE